MFIRDHIFCILTIFTNLWVFPTQALELNILDQPQTQGPKSELDLAGGTRVCPGFKNFVSVKIENEPGQLGVSCEMIAHLDALYDQVAAVSPVPLLMPALSMQNKVLPAIEQYEVVWMRFDLGVDTSRPEQLEALSPQFVHEVGHHIFYSNAYQNLAHLGYYKEAGEILLLYNLSMTRARVDVDSAEIFNHPSYQSFALMLDLLGSHFGTTETMLYDNISNAYQELFSDILAAVIYEDPEVMVNSIGEFDIQVDPEIHEKYLAYRSFTQNNPVTLESAQYYHYHFAPLRADLWNQWIGPRMGNKKQLLEELLKIFTEEIQRRVESGEEIKPLDDLQRVAANKKNVEALRAKLHLTQ